MEYLIPKEVFNLRERESYRNLATRGFNINQAKNLITTRQTLPIPRRRVQSRRISISVRGSLCYWRKRNSEKGHRKG